jgi:hypothetical protein
VPVRVTLRAAGVGPSSERLKVSVEDGPTRERTGARSGLGASTMRIRWEAWLQASARHRGRGWERADRAFGCGESETRAHGVALQARR